jgi:hypothetical protein
MKILCPACGRAIPGGDMDVPSRRAVCRNCSELIFLPDRASAQSSELPTVERDATAIARYRPAELAVSEIEESGGLTIALRARPQTARQTIALGSGIGFVLGLASVLGFLSHDPAAIPFAVLSAAMLAVAGVYGIGGLGRSRIALGVDGLRYQPAIGRKRTIPLAALHGIAVAPLQRGAMTLWGLRVLTADNQALLLPLELPAQDHAQYLAVRLNRALEEARTPRTYRG